MGTIPAPGPEQNPSFLRFSDRIKRAKIHPQEIYGDFGDSTEFIRSEVDKMLDEERERAFWERANPQIRPTRLTGKSIWFDNAINKGMTSRVELLSDEFGFTVKTIEENSEMKKPEIEIIEINLPEPADPDSYEKAMAAAKRRPGKFGVLSVTGDEAGYIESQEKAEEEIVRDDEFYLERMEAILEKVEENLEIEAHCSAPDGDVDLLRGKDGKFVLFEMYAEILHARTAFNMNEDYRGMTAMEGVSTPIGDYLDERKVVE